MVKTKKMSLLAFRIEAEEKQMIQNASDKENLSLSSYSRKILIENSKKVLGNGE